MQFAGKMVLIHCEIVASNDVAVVSCINTVAIYASCCGFAMLDNLLVACDMRTDKFLVPLCLAVARFANMRGIGVTEGVRLSMEYFFQGGL